MTELALPGADGRRPRLDSAEILKRFYVVERELARSAAGWVPGTARLEGKAALSLICWQSTLAADALRTRVFELRYPSRLLDETPDRPLTRVVAVARNAPDAASFAKALVEVVLPALEHGYRSYLDYADELADGPTRRFLELALREKQAQRQALTAIETPGSNGPWLAELDATLKRLGGFGIQPPAADAAVPDINDGGRTFVPSDPPAADDRYFSCTYYWPDVIDPVYSYGEGVGLQLRSAISHLNEVWAVDAAAHMLFALADELGWEFVLDASRWLYDESRHMLMGKKRLDTWGLAPELVPLGTYISDACSGQDPIVRLGMLGYFETKNIGKKRERAEEFANMGDETSERHMEFDWADETIHAEYGRRWLKRLLELRGSSASEYPAILDRCEELVTAKIAAATDEDRELMRGCADRLLASATVNATR